MAVIEKTGGSLSVTLWCGHQVRELGPVYASHPELGPMYKCPKCKHVVPKALKRVA